MDFVFHYSYLVEAASRELRLVYRVPMNRLHSMPLENEKINVIFNYFSAIFSACATHQKTA